jgi:glycosyltransferase involved in cell wall biosynthesis
MPTDSASALLGTLASQRPRILVLFGSAILLGAERANIEALAALKEQGCNILCLIRDEKWSTLVPPALEARGLAWKKVPYIEHRLPGRLFHILARNPVAFLRANWNFLRTVSEFRPTHIHAYGQLFVLNFLIGLKLIRTPMVFRAGDEPTLHNCFWRATWRFVVRRTTRFVANAEFVARSLRASGVPAERITVIYNRPPARPSLTSGGLALPLPEKARAFAFVGQIAEHKGPHLLVAAFRELADEFPNVHFLLAGRISEWRGDWARTLRDSTAQDPVVGHRVSFLGEIEDVPSLLARCEALVVPSLFNDPSPNVVMESKLVGRAAIVFPRGGLPELIEHGIDGLICREPSTGALVEALRTYLADPGLSAAHGKAALATSGRFGNAQFGKRWAEVYSVGNRSATPSCGIRIVTAMIRSSS